MCYKICKKDCFFCFFPLLLRVSKWQEPFWGFSFLLITSYPSVFRIFFPCHYSQKCFECLPVYSLLPEIDASELIHWHLHENGTLKWFRPVKCINGIQASLDCSVGLGLIWSYCRHSCHCFHCWKLKCNLIEPCCVWQIPLNELLL